MAAPGYDMYGRPIRPEYDPTYDPSKQSILPFVQERVSPLNMDTRGLERFRAEALKRGPSAYAMLANKMQAANLKDAKDRVAREGASSTAGAMNTLAMRGGATSGARERIAKAGNENVMNMTQNLEGQNAQNLLQISANDESNKMARLGQLPSMEVAAMSPQFEKARMEIGARGQDIGREVGEKQAKNLFDMTNYQEGMKSWAAARQARATENSGKK